MDENQRIEFALMKERVTNLFGQVNRFISHLESEQRVTGNISKRVDQLQHAIDRFEKDLDDKKKTYRWNWGLIISIISSIAIWVTIILTIIKN